MLDQEIVELYLKRNQEAIVETDKKYGKKLYRLSERILKTSEDAAENQNDTYFKAWQTIPPNKPQYFYLYLAKICRFLAFGRLDWENAKKRKADVVWLSQELESCIPDSKSERDLQNRETEMLINDFLRTLSAQERVLFMRRYWHMESIREIAERFDVSESKVTTQLWRTRKKFRNYLEKEGVRP